MGIFKNEPPAELQLDELQTFVYKLGLRSGEFQIVIQCEVSNGQGSIFSKEILHTGDGLSDERHEAEAKILDKCIAYIVGEGRRFKLSALQINNNESEYRRSAMCVEVSDGKGSNRKTLGTMIAIITSFDGKNRDQVLRALKKHSVHFWKLSKADMAPVSGKSYGADDCVKKSLVA